jgi:hypothetical protein
MRRKLAAVAVALVALVACGPTTKLNSVQVAPESPRAKVRNVVVVGLVKDAAARKSFEEQMVKALKSVGVQAEASQALLPIGEAPTREALQRLVAERNFDGAVVGMVVDSRTDVRAVPPAGGSSFYGYYGWAYPMAYSPGYLETTKTVVVETRLFRTTGDANAVFSATSESVDPINVREVTEPLAKLVVARLRKDGFV